MDDGITGVLLLLFCAAGLAFAGFVAGRDYETDKRDRAACEARCAPGAFVVRDGVCGCVVSVERGR